MEKFNVNETLQKQSMMDLTGKKQDYLNQLASYYNEIYNNHINYLLNIVSNLFVWENMPESLNGYRLKSSFFELMLTVNGACAMVDTKEWGVLISPCTIIGTLNPWGYPEALRLTPMYNTAGTVKFYNLNMELYQEKGDKFVYIMNNNLCTSLYPMVLECARDLTNIRMTFITNILQQKTPVIIRSDHDNKLSLDVVINKIMGYEPFIVLRNDSTLNLKEDTELFNADVKYIADKCQQAYVDTLNNFFIKIGINTLPNAKKERMVVDEVNSNNQAVQTAGDIMLTNREEACVRINDIFGYNIKVKRNVDFVEALTNNEKGGEDNE